MKKLVWYGVVFSFLLILLTGCGKSVDLSSFAEIKVSGYDGKAVAYVDID